MHTKDNATDLVVSVLVNCDGFLQFLQFAIYGHFLQLQLLSPLLFLLQPTSQLLVQPGTVHIHF